MKLIQEYFGNKQLDSEKVKEFKKSFIDLELFNFMSMRYKKVRYQVLSKDELINKTNKVQINKEIEIINLSIEPFEQSIVEADAKRSVQCKQRISVHSSRPAGIGPFRQGSNTASSQNESILIPGGFKQPERFTLVPYDNYR